MWIELADKLVQDNWNNLSKLQKYILDIREIVKKINDWEDQKTCKCSYFPLKDQVISAIKWELWMKFVAIKTWNNDAIERFAKFLLRQ